MRPICRVLAPRAVADRRRAGDPARHRHPGQREDHEDGVAPSDDLTAGETGRTRLVGVVLARLGHDSSWFGSDRWSSIVGGGCVFGCERSHAIVRSNRFDYSRSTVSEPVKDPGLSRDRTQAAPGRSVWGSARWAFRHRVRPSADRSGLATGRERAGAVSREHRTLQRRAPDTRGPCRRPRRPRSSRRRPRSARSPTGVESFRLGCVPLVDELAHTPRRSR